LAKFVVEGDANDASRARILRSYANLFLLHSNPTSAATGAPMAATERVSRALQVFSNIKLFDRSFEKSPGAFALRAAIELFNATQQSSTPSACDAIMQSVAVNAREARSALTASGAPDSIPVLLLEGIVAYYQRDFVGARAAFVRVMTLHPRCPASVRVALGQCLWQLGHQQVRGGGRGSAGQFLWQLGHQQVKVGGRGSAWGGCVLKCGKSRVVFDGWCQGCGPVLLFLRARLVYRLLLLRVLVRPLPKPLSGLCAWSLTTP
jgi:hypothetical protein